MSANIPERVRVAEYVKRILISGLTLFYQGKVRDIFNIPKYKQYLLMVASNRISIFDFVLNALVPKKGEILTALTHFWLTTVLKDYPNHLVPSRRLNGANGVMDILHLYPDIPPSRSLVVEKIKIPPWEIVFRFHLGGSVWKDYLKDGKVAGIQLMPGFKKWAKMEAPLFTPSTKAEDGHDINKTVQEYKDAMGDEGISSVIMFMHAYQSAYEYAKAQGILILDTKFEGLEKFGDEVLTPDSSRFTTVEDFERAIKEDRDPVSKDKQIVRNWGVTMETPFGVTGINNLKPENPEHVAFVSQLVVPEEVIYETAETYHWIFRRLVGKTLVDYQITNMRVY